MMTTSRNAPCPCGSGKKFKRCCIDKNPDPLDSEILPFLGTLQMNQYLLDQTLENSTPDDIIDLAMELMNMEQFTEAKALIESVLKTEPDHSYANYAYGLHHAQLCALEDAVHHFKVAIKYNPDFAEAWHNLGIAYRQQQTFNIPGAVECARNVVALAKQGKAFKSELNENRRFLKQIEKLVKRANGLTLDQYLNNAITYDQAFQHLEAHKLDEAIKGFHAVLHIEPTHYQSHGNLALCHAMLGDKQTALNHINKSLELYPDYAVAASNKPIIEALKEGEKLNKRTQTVNHGSTGIKPV